MAQNAPPSQDVQDIQFKLHDRFNIYPEGKDAKSFVSLLAVSSAKGLLFAGNFNSKELKVLKLRDIVDSKTTGQNINVRITNLPGEPKILACSCDGSMIAVNYVLNNTDFLQIYQVDSFVTPTINILYNLPIVPESNTFALQLLWNPVIPNNIALILTDGSVAMFTLNNDGQYGKITLGKEHQVKSGCWSPKGKQIVFGFAEGKLQQFKPNLQPARAISCPPGIHPGPFDCIAVHWLSTFQFAAIYLQRGRDMCPSLFIINAPKAGQLSFINYYDVCYSAPGPRMHQLSFNHIAQWNLLLVTSANGVEVGVLGTKETSDTPNWIQYTLLDEARIEMPLTESKDETYPLGFAFDNSSSHQVLIGEIKLPVMPMIHVLTTHGYLVSYNFLNLSSNAVDICSPPSPLNDLSGQFVPLKSQNLAESVPLTAVQGNLNVATSELAEGNKQNVGQGFGDMAFTLGSNIVTSTPAIKDKPLPLFGSKPGESKTTTAFGGPGGTGTASVQPPATSKSATGVVFGATTAAPSNVAPFSQQFGGMSPATSFGSFSATNLPAKPSEAVNSLPMQQQSVSIKKNNAEVNKPLYTVPPTFTPPTVPQQQTAKSEVKNVKTAITSNKININTGEIDEIVKQMIVIQIEAFGQELKHIRQQSKQLMENVGSPNEVKSYTKQLNDLNEILEQANDHEFEQDVQSLRHSMNESYAMLAECRTKLNLHNNPDLTRLSTVSYTDPTSRRQLAKLQAYAASNQNQLSQLNQLIDAQWSQYQDVVRRNSKNQMHIPCLDGIYQRMSKLKDLLSRQRAKMNYIKTKLKQKGLNYKPPSDVDVTTVAIGALTKNQSIMESLADSIISMSLSHVISVTHAKLSEEKLNAIRNYTKHHQQVAIIKPKRPDRVGLNSEVILETKLETERKQKEFAKKQLIQEQQQQQQLQQQLYQQQFYQQQYQQVSTYMTPMNYQHPLSSKVQQQQNYQSQQSQQLLKPQATLTASQQQQQPLLAKPTASKPTIVSSQPPTFITPTSSTAATLSFGGNSSFVKTSLSAPKSEETSKSAASSTTFTALSTTTQEGPIKPLTTNSNPSVVNDGKENKSASAPISFSAKVIGGNDVKPFANLGNKTATQTNTMQPTPPGFSVTPSSGFAAFGTTKSTAQTGGLDKEKTKKQEDQPKQFSFTTASTSSIASSTSAPTSFSGFAASIKSSTTTVPFSTQFAVVSSPSSFSFNNTVTTASTTNSITNNTTKPLTTTTSSSQNVALAKVKPAETKISTIATTAATPAISATSSSSTTKTTASGCKSSDASNVTSTSPGLPESKFTPAFSITPTSTEDLTDVLFGSLDICKPNTKEIGDPNKTENIFSEFTATTSSASAGPFSFTSVSGTAGDEPKSFLSSTSSSTGTTTTSGFSFVSAAASSGTSAAKVVAKPISTGTIAETTATEPITTFASLSTAETPTVTSSKTTAAPITTAATTSFSFIATAAGTVSTAGSLFGSLSVSSTTAASIVTTTTSTITSSGNTFSGGSSLFAQATTTSCTSSTASIFGGGAVVASSASSLFGSTAPAVATSVATPGLGSMFAAATTPTPPSGGIFGGIPKPEQSVFSAASTNPQPAGTGLFAAAAANSKPAVTTGGNIFGRSSSTWFGGSAAGSIFGGGNPTAPIPFSSPATANTGSSIFATAAAANQGTESGSIFSSPPQQSATSGGSIFNKTSFGGTAAQQSTGNIFGGGNTQSPPTGGLGASAGSIFGGSTSANTSASGGSLFGTAAAATSPVFGAPATSPLFGSFSQPSATPAFCSPTSGGFGATQTSLFDSSQQQSPFAKPVFGGPASFGSPQPAFGAQPTFGGAPTFGSPKGFSSFAATSPNNSGFCAPNQPAAAPKGNIFETLGAQDSGLSFGNLANSTQVPQQKPTFGGSSFMNYRS